MTFVNISTKTKVFAALAVVSIAATVISHCKDKKEAAEIEIDEEEYESIPVDPTEASPSI